MPANPKYLEKSSWQKFAKLSAGILGGYLITSLLHMTLALLIPLHKEILTTSLTTSYIVWVILIIIPYLFKNGWKVWGLYLCFIFILSGCYYLTITQNPLS